MPYQVDINQLAASINVTLVFGAVTTSSQSIQAFLSTSPNIYAHYSGYDLFGQADFWLSGRYNCNCNCDCTNCGGGK